jgi:Tfp pilus assembly protein PilE
MHNRRAFTLLEICLAMMIALLLVGIAIPSIRGVLDARALQNSFEEFQQLVLTAQARSVTERRTYLLSWEKDWLVLRPEELEKEEEKEGVARIRISSEERYDVKFPAALIDEPDPVWAFWPSGTCEPVEVTHKGPAGTWFARFHPLTAAADFSTR